MSNLTAHRPSCSRTLVSLHFFDIATLPSRPWRNGGGSTREIVCVPPEVELDAFDWRASVATIDRPGPFSTFPGVDRTTVWLAGADVRLCSRDGTTQHRLGRAHARLHRFGGELPIDGEPLGGASTVFNVMTRRSRWIGEVSVLRESGSIPSADAGLLLVSQGRWQLRTAAGRAPLDAGRGVWWEDGGGDSLVTPTRANALLIAVRLVRFADAAAHGAPSSRPR